MPFKFLSEMEKLIKELLTVSVLFLRRHTGTWELFVSVIGQTSAFVFGIYFLDTVLWYPGADSGFCLPFIAFLVSKGLPEGVYFFSVFASAKWADEDDKGPLPCSGAFVL